MNDLRIIKKKKAKKKGLSLHLSSSLSCLQPQRAAICVYHDGEEEFFESDVRAAKGGAGTALSSAEEVGR